MTDAFSTTIASLREQEGGFHIASPEEWRQGRTLFGGLSAALAVEASRRSFPDLPPLRSAQFAFIGPAEGELSLAPAMLRAGRTAAFASVVLSSPSGIAMQALFAYGAERSSAIDYLGLPCPAVPRAEDCPPFFGDSAPHYARQFEARLAGGASPISKADRPEFLLWLRHCDTGVHADVTSLIALADAPPPGALAMFAAPAPVSTLTWSLDLLATEFGGADWHLVQMIGEAARGGYSGQRMILWDGEGRPVLTSRQSVAIYG
jgi:acyl-CoA thioesterase